MTERFKCKNPRSAILRFHTQTAGCSLTAQQPYNNIVRVTIQALAAVLGGTQSLHTNSLDETMALPTEHAARIALRTQQILASESGVTNTADPLGGSYFVERLTLDMEKGCWEYFDRLDAMGGMVAAIEKGYPQREIQDASYEYQKAVERKEHIIVGVNEFVTEDAPPIDILSIDESVTGRQIEQLRKLRETRDNGRVRATVEALGRAARQSLADGSINMMPYILDCVRAYTTLGEICNELRAVYGVYEEPIV
jgi:methylmalonyl-CoA mutase N-terminal domain/subunit